MPIKVGAESRTIHETTAPYQHMVDGSLETSDIIVQYHSQTTAEIRQRRADMTARLAEDPEAVVWLSETLAASLHALPDLTDSKGKPFAITVENLDTIEVPNLEAIKAAIDKDIAGESQPSK